MSLTTWLTFLQWFPVLATVVLTGIFLWRRLYRELPLFFLYLVAALLIGATRYIGFLYLKAAVFFYVYWISDLAGTPVLLLAIYEVFLKRLFPGFLKTRFYRHLFPLVGAVILLLTVLTAIQAHDQRAAFRTASQAFDFARTAILGFCVVLILFMGRRWTKYNFAIVMGFGIQAAVAMINAAVRARLHGQSALMGYLELIAYDAGCLIWLIGFWKPEKPPHAASADQVNPQTVQQAREWEDSLKDWLTPGKRKP
jgi:hypothetical protein